MEKKNGYVKVDGKLYEVDDIDTCDLVPIAHFKLIEGNNYYTRSFTQYVRLKGMGILPAEEQSDGATRPVWNYVVDDAFMDVINKVTSPDYYYFSRKDADTYKRLVSKYFERDWKVVFK